MTRALLLLVLVACAPAAQPKAQPRGPARSPDVGLVDMTPASGADVPTLDALAATSMPLMREVKRVDGAREPIEIGAANDACFRAVVAASAPVRAWFTDRNHAPRGELADSAGLVPPRGPVCVKKGETLRFVVYAPNAGTVLRAVIWQSI